MSRSTAPASAPGPDKVLSINWHLLVRRFRARTGQFFTSARHRAANTEYIPPTWWSRLRLTWFRVGLIGLAVFVFTQKQIDFTVTVGAGSSAGTSGAVSQEAAAAPVSALSMVPASVPEESRWDVNHYEAATVRAYVNRFERVARTEEEKYAIPAAAKMAMAIVESQAGESSAARQHNNHFSTLSAGNQYDNAWSSWRSHSQEVSRRFPELANESVNHQQWIAALVKTGYSRDPHYGQKLLQVIDRFGLDRL